MKLGRDSALLRRVFQIDDVGACEGEGDHPLDIVALHCLLLL